MSEERMKKNLSTWLIGQLDLAALIGLIAPPPIDPDHFHLQFFSVDFFDDVMIRFVPPGCSRSDQLFHPDLLRRPRFDVFTDVRHSREHIERGAASAGDHMLHATTHPAVVLIPFHPMLEKVLVS